MKSLSGATFTISMVRGSVSRIEISFFDEKSGCLMARASVCPEGFANAVTGLACIPCDMTWNDSGKVGKTRENKNVRIDVCDFELPWSDSELSRALSPHETDGWIGRKDDLQNDHNRIDENAYTVLFERWV